MSLKVCKICYKCEKCFTEQGKCLKCESCIEEQICGKCEKCIVAQGECLECQKCYKAEIPCKVCYSCEKCFVSEEGAKRVLEKPIPKVSKELEIRFPNKINNITVWNTNNCPMYCKYCYVRRFGETLKPMDMSEETIAYFVDFCIKNLDENGSIWFFGGEPLVYFEGIKKIYELVHRIMPNVKFGLTTNLVLMDEEKAKWLGKRGFGILCSLDGGKERHDKYRVFKDGSGSWDMAFEGLKNVRKYINVNPEIRWTTSPDTVDNLYKDFINLAELGLTNAVIELVYEAEWSEEQIKKYGDEIRKIAEFILESNNMYVMKQISDLSMAFNPQPLNWRDRCGLGQGGIGIDVKGDIYLCHRFVVNQKEEHKIGNVKDGFDMNKRIEINKKWISKRFTSEKGKCENCPLYWSCMGGCLAVNYDTTGNMKIVPEVYCKLKREEFNRLADLAIIMRNRGKLRRIQT